jgi:uncharacterized repeat protein (TIGR03803 family)
VFEVKLSGTETVLHAFEAGSDGYFPESGLTMDKVGNLFGTTVGGGNGCGGEYGCGTVFKIAPDGTETVLYSFAGGNDGSAPYGSLLGDNDGNLYGTTAGDGVDNSGTVFKLAPDGTETVLYSFRGGSDGEQPRAGLIADKSGNLYGTTFYGGGTGCYERAGCGTAFKIAPNGTETVLYAFRDDNSAHPLASLLASQNGILYGTAIGKKRLGRSGGEVFQLKE